MRARMTREEYNEILATEPATPTQVGAIIGEWRRLGLDADVDRGERLALTAQLLGLAEVGSTMDLVMGDAGRLLRMLMDYVDRADLDALLPAAAEPQLPEPAAPPRPRQPLLQVLAQAMADAERLSGNSATIRIWPGRAHRQAGTPAQAPR